MSKADDCNFVGQLGVDSPIFTGTSITGDFSEALRIAIAEAKRQLGSSLVNWQLGSLDGVNGGFVGQNDLTVSIHATAGPGDDTRGVGADAVGPEERYSYKFDYGYFLIRSGNGGGYMLGVEPPGPTTDAIPSYFTCCKLAFVRNFDITLNTVTINGWVYQATQYTQYEPRGQGNNPRPYRYFFVASDDNGDGTFYIGQSNVSNDRVKFQNQAYKSNTTRTEIDG